MSAHPDDLAVIVRSEASLATAKVEDPDCAAALGVTKKVSDDTGAPGTAVHLGAWDVRVFASAGTEASG